MCSASAAGVGGVRRRIEGSLSFGLMDAVTAVRFYHQRQACRAAEVGTTKSVSRRNRCFQRTFTSSTRIPYKVPNNGQWGEHSGDMTPFLFLGRYNQGVGQRL
jgi:hypothetical protein